MGGSSAAKFVALALWCCMPVACGSANESNASSGSERDAAGEGGGQGLLDASTDSLSRGSADVLVAETATGDGTSSPTIDGGALGSGDDGLDEGDAPAPNADDAAAPSEASAGDAATTDATVYHPPYPSVTNIDDGGMTGPIAVVSIVASNDTLQANLFAFGDALTQSQWWTAVSAPYGLGAMTHRKIVGKALAAGNRTNKQLQQYIESELRSNALTPDARTIHLLYLPDGVVVTDDDGKNANIACGSYKGYHTYDTYTPNRDFIWGTVQRCAPSNEIMGLPTTLDVTTQTASHEIAEAATNPHDDDGWSLYGTARPPVETPWALAPAPPGEIGDLCAWTAYAEGGFKFTRIWSNAAAKAGADPCVPAGTDPYHCASASPDWWPLSNGTAQIAVRGFTSGSASADWYTWAYVAYGSSAAINAATVGPTRLHLMDGLGGTFAVSAPKAVSGDYGVLLLVTQTANELHPWAVGIYVP